MSSDVDKDDDDYFSSLPSTSLANVFTKTNISDTTTENTSLNYIPVKPKKEGYEPECVFTRFFTAFEWTNSNYVSKGKVGLAVIQDVQNYSYNVLIYDASKSPLCYINVTPAFNVKVKNTEYIFFYDDAQRYWMLNSNCDDIEETTNMFKRLGVDVIDISDDVKETELQIVKKEFNGNIASIKADNRESDTDSFAYQQNKAAILKRMASMGQAILPDVKTSRVQTNDSSSDDGKPDMKAIHKPNKTKLNTKFCLNTIPKENSGINHMETSRGNLSNSQVITGDRSSLYHSQNEKLSILMAEQKISNSELRINLGRISDKVDEAIKNITDLRQNCNTEFHAEVYRKLLNEYENKIKILQDAHSLKQIDTTNNQLATSNSNYDVIRNFEIEINNLRCTIKEKETQIFNLECELRNLSTHIKKEQLNSSLAAQIDELKQMIKNVNVDVKPKTNEQFYTQEQVKEIMNEVFHSVSDQLVNNSNNTYTNENIKKIVGNSIKKVTLELINKP